MPAAPASPAAAAAAPQPTPVKDWWNAAPTEDSMRKLTKAKPLEPAAKVREWKTAASAPTAPSGMPSWVTREFRHGLARHVLAYLQPHYPERFHHNHEHFKDVARRATLKTIDYCVSHLIADPNHQAARHSAKHFAEFFFSQYTRSSRASASASTSAAHDK